MHRAPPADAPRVVAKLTPRQIAVAALVARAWPDKRIAHELRIEVDTVREHIEKIAKTLRLDPTCNTRILIAFWFRELAPIAVPDTSLPHDGARLAG